jgi:hypothetical protein
VGTWASFLSESLPQLTTQVIEGKAHDTVGRLNNTTEQTLLLLKRYHVIAENSRPFKSTPSKDSMEI